MNELRIDRATAFRGVEETPQGGLRVAAALTRTGVFTYRLADGSEVREYRSPEEVFKADSLATLRGAPLTDDHPAGPVTRENWKALSVGHVADDVQAEGSHVVAHLLVQDALEVTRVQNKERVELSCGYACEVVAAPGVSPQGEPYDRQQVNIVYNHVALGPPGWGRAGPSVALRMDGAGVELVAGAARAQENKPMEIKFRGKVYKTDSPEDMAAMQAAADAEAMAPKEEPVAKKDEQPVPAANLAGMMGKLEELLPLLNLLVAGMKANATAEPDGDEGEEMALDSRLALRDDARLVLGATFDPKGQKDDAIRRAVVARAFPALKLDSKSADEVKGLFVAAVEQARATAAQRADAAEKQSKLDAAAGSVGTDAPADRGTRADGEAVSKSTVERWKQPTTLTRNGGK